jgi:hypothetical protein
VCLSVYLRNVKAFRDFYLNPRPLEARAMMVSPALHEKNRSFVIVNFRLSYFGQLNSSTTRHLDIGLVAKNSLLSLSVYVSMEKIWDACGIGIQKS